MCKLRATCGYLVTASIGHLGLNIDTSWAEWPDDVTTMMAAATPRWAARTVARAMAVMWSQGSGV